MEAVVAARTTTFAKPVRAHGLNVWCLAASYDFVGTGTKAYDWVIATNDLTLLPNWNVPGNATKFLPSVPLENLLEDWFFASALGGKCGSVCGVRSSAK